MRLKILRAILFFIAFYFSIDSVYMFLNYQLKINKYEVEIFCFSMIF